MNQTLPTRQLVRFVLSRPSHPGNIGAAARAMRTMGFTRLALVSPRRYPDAEADALSAGAFELMPVPGIHAQLSEAIADCTLVVGMSARRRGVNLPELTPRQGAGRVFAAAAGGEQTAVVFGNERTGLENDELMRCHVMVRIPSAADFSSLNLSQAVQVMAYELALAFDDASAHAPPLSRERPASAEQMEHFFTHLAQTLDDIDFHKGRSPHTIMLRLRKMFLRTRLEQREVRVLRGIFSEAQRMATLAREHRHEK